MASQAFQIGDRLVGPGQPAYIVAEMSGNHNHDYDAAVQIVKEAKDAGADAIKLQTYTADTLTIDCDAESFQIPDGNMWSGRTLFDLYTQAYTPWDWQPKLKAVAEEIGIELFSAPFDAAAVDFLEALDVNVYKIASFELVDLELIRKVAETGKPMIMSTGLSTLAEIEEAVAVARDAGCEELILLQCTSSYPASPADSNLRSIPHLAEMFGLPVGLSDHTHGTSIAIAGVAVGACLVEKHLRLRGAKGGPDAGFSMDPDELRDLVNGVRVVEEALGPVDYSVTESEEKNRCFRRSLFIIKDVREGEALSRENIRCIRPGNGLPPRFLPNVLGKMAARDLSRGEPLTWESVCSVGS